MSERTVILDKDAELQQAREQVERAQQELARLQARGHDDEASSEPNSQPGDAETELRKDSMMAHLLDSLKEGRDIGHYGRLVFAMIARHFMPSEDVLAWLMRDPDFAQGDAENMLRQVDGRDYNPPRRERLLEWQKEQSFPILPSPEDPDCGNVYRNLKFPDAVYNHIGKYQEQKADAEN